MTAPWQQLTSSTQIASSSKRSSQRKLLRTDKSSLAVMESLHLSVMFVFVLATPLIKASAPRQKPKPALLRGMHVICFDPKDSCKKFEPCQNGGTCSVTGDKNQPYRCDCVFGFGGENCEKILGESTCFCFVGKEFKRITEMIKSLGQLLRVKNKLECVKMAWYRWGEKPYGRTWSATWIVEIATETKMNARKQPVVRICTIGRQNS